MHYLLDANVFIDAVRKQYFGFDLCPGFWTWVETAGRNGVCSSIAAVRAELLPGDELADWAAEQPDGFFADPDSVTIDGLRRVAEWSDTSDHTPAAKADFLAKADSVLVATALARELTVVTLETPRPERNRIKIPVACAALGVQCTTTFAFLRREHATFVLGARP